MHLKTRQFSNLLCSFCETLTRCSSIESLDNRLVTNVPAAAERSGCHRLLILFSFSSGDGSSKNVCLNCVSEEEEDEDLPPGFSFLAKKGAGLHTHYTSVFPHTHQ